MRELASGMPLFLIEISSDFLSNSTQASLHTYAEGDRCVSILFKLVFSSILIDNWFAKTIEHTSL